ncbi:uncharacterized protein BJ212DRAFT_1547620 [Suillus subaureus]|uniref:Complex 1 LYR protein domain-containing protein n=1 Tax=Suillus subaureus TaxID=48587 RepID=A0A9P7EI14_9AGAM|nr:uncharacterized protein BJ212DRAFT_1547620 [Suillus subaureus]KAG1821911.1 hypothetical protein BJ212DRAFT_1547620 [Suillus subaureus]
MASKATRLRALALYKELHRLGRDYEPSYDFHGKLRRMFEKNRNLTDDDEIEKALRFGEYIKNGENPCLVFASQISTSEADVSFKHCVRYLTDRYHHSWHRPNSTLSFMTTDVVGRGVRKNSEARG